jgi:hypothetical protein
MLLAVTSAGCLHAQRPDSRTYVISEDSSGVATGGSGALILAPLAL